MHAPLVVVALVLAACAYELPLDSIEAASYGAGGAGGGGGPPFPLAVVPSAPLDGAASVVEIRLDEPPDGVTADRVVVATGVLSDQHLRELEEDNVSMALAARILEVVAWTEPSGAIVVAPSAALDPGETYSVALADAFVSATFSVDAAPPPVLPRIWPPVGDAASTSFGVWCGATALEGPAAGARLEPTGPSGELAVGVDGVDRRCVSFASRDAAERSGPFAPPPSFTSSSGVVASLDPRPFTRDRAHAIAVEALACHADEVQIGPGCGVVEDDQIVGRSPREPLLWAASGGSVDSVFATAPGDAFVLGPLPVDADVLLALATFDVAGVASRATVRVKTAAARPHVILNEVLADPVGPEPAEEWVELVNDGQVAADLTGYVLDDLGGETPLPSATLPPGAFALLVGADFVADDGYDPKPASGALILRVPRVGSRGLSNDGEPLTLKAPDGSTVSSFPPSPKPKSGMSVARTSPRAPDGIASSFVLATPTPGRANATTSP
ncbi:MAG TPA: lamin tail domain-containing protein [Byssovorax sp.]